MEEYNYDFQRVLDAEKAEEQPAAPVLSGPEKPPYGKMFAAVIVHTVAVGLISVLFGAVTFAVTGDTIDASSPFVRVGLPVLAMLYWGLYVLIPFLFAKGTYKTHKPRLAFVGCFYVLSTLTSAVESITAKILELAQVNLAAPDLLEGTAVLNGVFSGLSTVVTIVIQVAVLFLVVKWAAENGLFEEKTSLSETLLVRSETKMPIIAAACAAFMFLSDTGLGMLVMRFYTEEPGVRNILLLASAGFVSIASVILCFEVGKRIFERIDGALLFTGLVTGASAVSFGKGIVDLIYALISTLCGTSIPGFVNTAVSIVSVAAGTAVAALIAFTVVRRYEAKSRISHQETAE